MKLKYFLQILSEFDVESEIEFDVKVSKQLKILVDCQMYILMMKLL